MNRVMWLRLGLLCVLIYWLVLIMIIMSSMQPARSAPSTEPPVAVQPTFPPPPTQDESIKRVMWTIGVFNSLVRQKICPDYEKLDVEAIYNKAVVQAAGLGPAHQPVEYYNAGLYTAKLEGSRMRKLCPKLRKHMTTLGYWILK